jgi:hypothetical protein
MTAPISERGVFLWPLNEYSAGLSPDLASDSGCWGNEQRVALGLLQGKIAWVRFRHFTQTGLVHIHEDSHQPKESVDSWDETNQERKETRPRPCLMVALSGVDERAWLDKWIMTVDDPLSSRYKCSQKPNYETNIRKLSRANIFIILMMLTFSGRGLANRAFSAFRGKPASGTGIPVHQSSLLALRGSYSTDRNCSFAMNKSP